MIKCRKGSYHQSRRILCIAIILCISVICFSTFAIDAHAKVELLNSDTAINIINMYATEKSTNFAIVSSTQLKSISTQSYDYTLYLLSPFGYAILHNETGALVEASYTPETELPFNSVDSNVVYYGGPFKYFTKNKDTFINLFDGKYFTSDELESVRKFESAANSSFSSIKHAVSISSNEDRSSSSNDLVSYYVKESYFSNLTNFGENTNNTCTIVAIAMLLGYYDYYISDLYVPSMYEQGNGTNDAFHLYLNTLVYGTPTPTTGGVYIRNAAPEINTYLDAMDVTANFSYTYMLINNAALTNGIIGKISNQIPVVASMETERGGPSDHTLLIYGVEYEASDPTGTACYIAHMGWSEQNYYRCVVLNHSWFYEYGYIKCGLSSHEQLTNWSLYTSSTHRSTCHCGVTVYEPHDAYLLATGYCLRCKVYVDDTAIW